MLTMLSGLAVGHLVYSVFEGAGVGEGVLGQWVPVVIGVTVVWVVLRRLWQPELKHL